MHAFSSIEVYYTQDNIYETIISMIGGPCRFFAEEYGCMATGIDITAAYIDTAKRLSQLSGLQQGTRFVQASATDLPFPMGETALEKLQNLYRNLSEKKIVVESGIVIKEI